MRLVAKILRSEYTARQIKQSVCGYGAAGETVQEMVCRIPKPRVTPQADAADGLACAICRRKPFNEQF